jgi:hypothetical protein
VAFTNKNNNRKSLHRADTRTKLCIYSTSTWYLQVHCCDDSIKEFNGRALRQFAMARFNEWRPRPRCTRAQGGSLYITRSNYVYILVGRVRNDALGIRIGVLCL